MITPLSEDCPCEAVVIVVMRVNAWMKIGFAIHSDQMWLDTIEHACVTI